MKRMQKRRIFTAPFMWRRKCQVAVGNSSSTSKTSQPSHPKKKNKVEKPYPLQPPTFPGRPFRQRRLCASKMPLLLPVVYMLYAPMYITSLRIASDTRVSPFFFFVPPCSSTETFPQMSTTCAQVAFSVSFTPAIAVSFATDVCRRVGKLFSVWMCMFRFSPLYFFFSHFSPFLPFFFVCTLLHFSMPFI